MDESISRLLSDPQRLTEVSEAVKALFAETSPAPASAAAEPRDIASSGAQPPEAPESGDRGDPKLALLCAIKPFVSDVRQQRIDKIMKVMSLAELYGSFRNLL